ncbi:hypothetical protein FQN60_000109 [Etheostoma spectabile]|uniref:Uncharacterized protein n=1 Tax=Etheostoma spectabile TaxID=54343 RepID=A0A5J5C811_9PERO|nr:hypothetical protein FQN60_000109 [Etheostoma spectabile]
MVKGKTKTFYRQAEAGTSESSARARIGRALNSLAQRKPSRSPNRLRDLSWMVAHEILPSGP